MRISGLVRQTPSSPHNVRPLPFDTVLIYYVPFYIECMVKIVLFYLEHTPRLVPRAECLETDEQHTLISTTAAEADDSSHSR